MDYDGLKLRDRFRGALIGLMCGDALGAAVEGWSANDICEHYGRVRDMETARGAPGTYTDDTQMAIGLAEGLLAAPGRTDQDAIAAAFAENFEPWRGYGGSVGMILNEITNGGHWSEAVEQFGYPGGSGANGSAMRVAPCALAFFPNSSEVARSAREQAVVSGHHGEDGKSGAMVQAVAVLKAMEAGLRGATMDRVRFIELLMPHASESFIEPLSWIAANGDASPDEAVEVLGVRVPIFQSVPAAIWSFLASPSDPEEVIVRAVNLGGDTDTIGAMAGAMAGAYSGYSVLPGRWVDMLENEGKGRDYILDLADRLFGFFEERAAIAS